VGGTAYTQKRGKKKESEQSFSGRGKVKGCGAPIIRLVKAIT